MKITSVLKMIPDIYKITNTLDGKGYVGQTVKLLRRFWTHVGALRLKNHKNRHLQFAVNRDGIENFTFEILELLPLDKNLLTEREDYWINFYNTCDSQFGYNVASAKNGHLGLKRNSVTREKLSCRRKGIVLSEEHKQRIGMSVHNFYIDHPELGSVKVQKAQKAAADWHRGKSRPESEKVSIQASMKKIIQEKGPEEVRRLKKISALGAEHSAAIRRELSAKRLNLSPEEKVAYDAIYQQDKTPREIGNDRKRFVRALEKARRTKE